MSTHVSPCDVIGGVTPRWTSDIVHRTATIVRASVGIHPSLLCKRMQAKCWPSSQCFVYRERKQLCSRCSRLYLHSEIFYINTSFLSHPENLIGKAIRSSKNLRIPPKLRSGGILGNFRSFDLDKNYGKKIYQEMIRSLQLLIRNIRSSKNLRIPPKFRPRSYLEVTARHL